MAPQGTWVNSVNGHRCGKEAVQRGAHALETSGSAAGYSVAVPVLHSTTAAVERTVFMSLLGSHVWPRGGGGGCCRCYMGMLHSWAALHGEKENTQAAAGVLTRKTRHQ
jgi:hypothetical protein